MKVEDILVRVQRQFGDEAGVQVQDADIIRWVNDAQKEACMQHEGLLLDSYSMRLFAGQQNYDMPDTVLDIFTVELYVVEEASYPLQFLSIKEMDAYVFGWRLSTQTSTPQVWTRGQKKGRIAIYPASDVDVDDGLLINHSKYPLDITALSDFTELPGYYDTYLLEYCLMKSYEMDENWDAADRKAAYVQSTLDFNNSRDSESAKQSYAVVGPTAEDYV